VGGNGRGLGTRRGWASVVALAVLIGLPAFLSGQGAPPAPPVLALDGLDRLYFERLASPPARGGPDWPIDWRLVPSNFPPSLSSSDAPPGVRDFPLPRRPSAVLRQLLDRSHPRITTQYWALYLEGQRTDLWFFAPLPERTEGKLLAPYEVEGIRASGAAGLVIETCGSMFRPQGAWWWQGRDFYLVDEGEQLRLERVVTRFHASRGYDLGTVPPLAVYAERPLADGGVEVRSLDAVSEAAQAACRFVDPAGAAPVTCAILESAVRCLADRPEAVRTVRPAGTPSFIERGGKPQSRGSGGDHE
jgi:hypothetical protein